MDLSESCLAEAQFHELPKFEQGKVRESYSLPDGRRVMVATDRQSAFDQVLASVPYKGQVLNQTAQFWFNKTEDICPNHVVNYPDPNVIIAKDLEMLPVEMVVRDYITGSTETSIWPMYERGERTLYGINFPEGLKKNQKLPETILTPTTKAVQGDHDAPITPAEIVAQGLLDQEHWDELARISLAIFARGREIAAENGLILVDTKYEFGLIGDELIVIDEIHTPDSSRYWVKDSYLERYEKNEDQKMLDKENIRKWLIDRGFSGEGTPPELSDEIRIFLTEQYISLYKKITGKDFEPAIGDVKSRILENLKSENF